MNNSTLQIIKENEELKKKLKLYEISTKLDYEKIQKLKDEIIYLKYINDMQLIFICIFGRKNFKKTNKSFSCIFGRVSIYIFFENL